MNNDVSLSAILDEDALRGILSAFRSSTGYDGVFISPDGAQSTDVACSMRDAQLPAMIEAGRRAASSGQPLVTRDDEGAARIVVPIVYKDAYFGAVHIGSSAAGNRDINAAAQLMFITLSSVVCAGMTALLSQQEMDVQRMHISNLIMEKKRAEETILRTMSGTYPLHKEKELMTNVRLGDKSGARRILNEMLGWVFLSYAGNIDVMKARIVELLVMMSRAAVETGAPLAQLLAMNNQNITELSDIQTFEHLCAWVVRALDAFMELVYSTRNERNARFIGDALTYMRSNYSQPLTLASVAKVAHISPYYLSHLFREELGETFLERLTFIRMDKAKELLHNTDYTVASIAGSIGYEDAGYFSKVFRKATGQTPHQYRTSYRE